MTPEEAMPLVLLALETCEPPSGWKRQREPHEPPPKVATAILWAEAFTLAGVDAREARIGLVRYLNQPQQGSYRLPLPSPGHIIAHTPAGRAYGYLGSDRDADRALSLMERRLADLGYAPVRGIPSRTLDPDDPYRDDAMWAALNVVGGADAWGNKAEGDRAIPSAWRAAYVAARSDQRYQGDAIAYTAAALEQRARPLALREVSSTKVIPMDRERRRE